MPLETHREKLPLVRLAGSRSRVRLSGAVGDLAGCEDVLVYAAEHVESMVLMQVISCKRLPFGL